MGVALSSLNNVRVRLPFEGCSLVARVVNRQAYFGESSEHEGANNSRWLTTAVFVIKPSNHYAAALVPTSARRGVGWFSSNARRTAHCYCRPSHPIPNHTWYAAISMGSWGCRVLRLESTRRKKIFALFVKEGRPRTCCFRCMQAANCFLRDIIWASYKALV